ncbi:MAG: sensor histidine kinase [Ginsengibacter sp.]
MRYFYFLFAFLFAQNVYAQASEKSADKIIFGSRTYNNEKIKIQKQLDSTNSFPEIVSITTRAIELSLKESDSAFMAAMLQKRGVSNYFNGNYDKAATDYYRTIQIFKNINDLKNLAYTYNELAKLYRKTRDLDLAMENYDKALNIFTSQKDSAGISMILNESGVVYEYKKNYPKALQRYHASLAIATIMNDSVGISYALSFIAGVYTLQEKYSEAINYLKKSLTIRQRLNDPLALSLNYADLGMTSSANKEYTEAKNFFNKSNHIAEALDYKEIQLSNYEELSNIAEKTGDYGNSLKYYKIKTTISDSLYTLDKTKQIQELSTKYQTEKKESQIALQANEIKRKNLIIVTVASILLFSILLGISLYRKRKLQQQALFQKQLIEQQHAATKAVMEAEEHERKRIAQDLHDGVGQMMSAAKMNLSTFENNIHEDDEESKKSLNKIINLVDESCREVRNVSHQMMPNALLKNSLAAALNLFVEQIDTRLVRVHIFTEGVESKIESSIEIVLYRIIQECVNNVLKHAKATDIDITVIKDEKEVSVAIEDNGNGQLTQKMADGDGIGIQTIKARVAYLNGFVEFNSEPGNGSVVSLQIPLNQQL